MRHIRDVLSLAKQVYYPDHSNDQAGDEHEEIPAWMNWFYRLFREEEGVETISAQAERERGKSRAVAASLVGHQSLLGYSGAEPRDFCTETTRNAGAHSNCCQVIGQLETERAAANKLVHVVQTANVFLVDAQEEAFIDTMIYLVLLQTTQSPDSSVLE